MSEGTELRLVFILGLVALAVGTLAVAGVTQWLRGRVTRGREWLAASRLRSPRVDRAPLGMHRQMEARSARWRMLL